MKKLFYIILIVIIAGFLASHEEDITPAGYMVLLGIFWLAGYIVKEYQKISKDIKDLDKYKDINDVINKYGVPSDVQEYDEYKKYIFKKSTNGWARHKYKVDIFTLQKGKLIKHENYHE